MADTGLKLGGKRLQTFATRHQIEDLFAGFLAFPKIGSYLAVDQYNVVIGDRESVMYIVRISTVAAGPAPGGVAKDFRWRCTPTVLSLRYPGTIYVGWRVEGRQGSAGDAPSTDRHLRGK